jgi:fucose permease
MALFVLAGNVALAAALVALYSGASILWGTWTTTLVQEGRPSTRVGEVMGVLLSILNVGLLLGAVLALALAPRLGWERTLLVATAGASAIVAVAWSLPLTRRLAAGLEPAHA